MPPNKSTGSFRITRVYGPDNRQIVAESVLEADVAAILEARRDVVELRDQWPVVHYHDEAGREHRHTFDFWVRRTSGTRIAVAVKPSERVESSGLRRIIELASSQGLGGFADRAVIFTDKDVKNGPAWNAREILRARKLRNECDVQEMRILLQSVRGSVLFHQLIAGTELPWKCRNAVWSLLDEGFLVPVSPGRITPHSYLRVASQISKKA